MGFYDIDYDNLVNTHLPVEERRAVRYAWVKTLVSAVKSVYTRFMTFRADRKYLLEHNSQVCYMEAALNDLFDPVDRLIYITDGPFADPTYIYLAIEEKDVWVALDSELPVIDYEAPVYLYTDDETSDMGVKFIVHVPDTIDLPTVLVRMRALVDRYRLVSISYYSVVTYTP